MVRLTTFVVSPVSPAPYLGDCGHARSTLSTFHRLRMGIVGRPYGIQLGCQCGATALTTSTRHLISECPLTAHHALMCGITGLECLHRDTDASLEFAKRAHDAGADWGVRV